MKVKKESCLIFLIILCFLSFIFGIGSNLKITSGISNITLNSNVLDDFSSDNKFKIEDFSVDNSDFSLKVIQIAEVEKDLLVYVYQPCIQRDFRATSINISTALGDDLSFTNYKLTYLNSEETLYKYKVEGLIVGSEEKRYYEVSSVFRAWNKFIDKETDKIIENTIDEVVYKVAKAYTFAGFGSDKVVFSQDVEVVEVVSKYIGFVRYKDGFIFHRGSCDSHFLAFSTDKNIERLVQVEMSFVSNYRNEVFPSKNKTEIKKVVLSEEDDFCFKPFWDKQKIRDRIVTAENFVKVEKLEKDIESLVLEKDWVLRFYESEYSHAGGVSFPQEEYTRVSEVTLLRLKFETEGKIYNLGVVDNKQTGGDNPVNKTVMPYWAKILFLVGIGILVFVLICFIAPQFIILFIKFVFTIILWILKALWWLVSLPFRLFKKD